MKKFLTLLTIAALMIAVPYSASAFGNCEGRECYQVDAFAAPNASFYGYLPFIGLSGPNGGGAIGNFDMGAEAHAMGQDDTKWVRVQDPEPSGRYAYYEKLYGRHAGRIYKKPFVDHPYKKTEWRYVGPYYGTHWEEIIIAGEGLADGFLQPTISTNVTETYLQDTPQVQELVVTSTSTLRSRHVPTDKSGNDRAAGFSPRGAPSDERAAGFRWTENPFSVPL